MYSVGRYSQYKEIRLTKALATVPLPWTVTTVLLRDSSKVPIILGKV